MLSLVTCRSALILIVATIRLAQFKTLNEFFSDIFCADRVGVGGQRKPL